MDDKYFEDKEDLRQEYLKWRAAQKRASQAKRRAELREAIVMLAIGIGMLFTLIFTGSKFLRPESSRLDSSEVQALDSRVSRLSSDLHISSAKLDNFIAKHPAGAVVESDDSKEIRALDQRMSRLEQAISNSPEKALSIPLLRKDVDNLASKVVENQARIDAEVRDVSAAVTRIYWALISAMGILIASGAGFLFRLIGSKKNNEVEE